MEHKNYPRLTHFRDGLCHTKLYSIYDDLIIDEVFLLPENSDIYIVKFTNKLCLTAQNNSGEH